MSIFKWDESYSVQVTEMDDQHKVLVGLINRLHDAMKEKKAKDIQKGILQELITYTKTHFTEEEEYLEKHNYPYLNEQKKQHEEFVAKLREFIRDYKDGKLMLSFDIMKFLKDWLINHILKIDQKYTTYFKENGII
ncbi:MAG: hemerythrin family protein [bacterium]|nr:hemerythrin family protein [bacterium]